jgi:hypothetical protein
MNKAYPAGQWWPLVDIERVHRDLAMTKDLGKGIYHSDLME